MTIPGKKNERGAATVEFCFSALIWLPLLLGTAVFGVDLVQAIQLSQLSRETGHMYAYGIDFTQPQNAPLLQRLALPLNIQQNGAIVLSKITLVTQSDCNAASNNICANKDKYVFTSIYVFGNHTYAQTKLGNPQGYLFNGTAIKESDYLSQPALVATNFSSVLTFVPNQPGQYAFISEVTLNSQAVAWSDFSNTGSYARTIF